MARAAVVLLVMMTASASVVAQAPPGPRFEAASLKERARNTEPGLVGMQRQPGRLLNRCATLTSLVFYAFDLTFSKPIEGLPDWADMPCSRVDSTNTYEFQATMPGETTEGDARLMLQAFLVERFKLAFHWETRTLPVFALVVTPGGFKLKPSNPKDDPPRTRGSIGCPADDPGCHVMPLGSAPMSLLVSALARTAGRPVVDKTDLPGTYYLDLKWAGDNSPNSSLPSLPTVLREQLGVELKSETGPVEILVIDRAEQPTGN